MKRLLAAAAACFAACAAAHAAPMTIGGVAFDTDNAATEVTFAQGGHFVGPERNRRGPGDAVPEVVGFDLTTYWEIDKNGPLYPDDVLAVTFAQELANGAGNCAVGDYAGCDVLVFEVLNQDDNPTVSVSLGGQTTLGVLLAEVMVATTEGNKRVGIYGFDFSALAVAVGDTVGNPIFVGRPTSGEGSPDIAAVVGLNFGQMQPPAEVPLPGAAPLLLAGLAGLGFATRRSKTALKR